MNTGYPYNYPGIAPYQNFPNSNPGVPSNPYFEARAGVGNDDLLPYREDAAPLIPTAPMEPIPGYAGVGFGDDSVSLPPRSEDVITNFPEQRPELKGASVISSDEARNALVNHCKTKCCWGTKAANEMNILNMRSTSAFQYRLESFGEMRTTKWTSVPYTGEIIDGPNNGYPPMPWEIPIAFNEKFKSEERSLEIPHTACVKGCEFCRAGGFLRCNSCNGRGRTTCNSCNGSGRKQKLTFDNESQWENCFPCNGCGYSRCHRCSETGRIRCNKCQGHCHIKWFIQLNVKWTNHFEDYIYEQTGLPQALIKEVGGDVAFQEENVRVFPILHCPVSSINKASADLIASHANKFQSERILIQRHTVKIVPITEVEAQWKSDVFRFFVYGLEKNVHTENYPQTKCCGCSII